MRRLIHCITKELVGEQGIGKETIALIVSRFQTIIFTLWLYLFPIVVSSSRANAQMSDHKIDFMAIDNYIADKMRFPHIPGVAIAIVKGDKIIYLKGYGKASLYGNPVTPETPFIIGSVTKAFTARL